MTLASKCSFNSLFNIHLTVENPHRIVIDPFSLVNYPSRQNIWTTPLLKNIGEQYAASQ